MEARSGQNHDNNIAQQVSFNPTQQIFWTCCLFLSSINNTFFRMLVIIFSNISYFCFNCCRASAGSRPYSWAIWWFLVRWFHGSIIKCLAAAPVFLFRATRHFVLFSCEFKICAEVVVHRMFALFLNSLNGKNSSRTIARDIFSAFSNARFQD